MKSETKNNLKHDYFFTETFNQEKLFFYKNYDLKNILKNNLLNSSNKLVNLILEKKEIDERVSGIEIISDTQYQLDGKYYAEGNVVIILEDGELKADKLIYNQLEKNLILDGNISYFKGNQYVEAK
ncbi:hypothetical protein OA778_02900, partial [Prochlorococcus sp. AH-716-I09]|nr:hypothetical protein [Prochlorococcus sp. AH-716-I09]